MRFFKMPMAGPGYVILNVLRCYNIIALATVMVASWVMLVKTFIISKASHLSLLNFFFFDSVSHVVISTISMFLIVSELCLFRTYFAKNWPLLSPSSGFVTLGVAMMVVGVSILGNLNKQATSQESLGLAFWRIVIASGIVIIVLGFANIVVSYVFRDKRLDVTARQIRAHGAVATQHPTTTLSASSSRKSFRSELVRKATLPTHHTNEYEPRRPLSFKMPINISRPMNTNTQFKDHARGAPVNHADDPQHPIYAQMTHDAPVRMPEVSYHPAYNQRF
ncbi:MAG: hypothetical protein M1817_004009 [Caeruleum heppii]|nr:MAG: hypothetical protein M1817_004009 [Caeruleum heppii]